MIGKGLGVIAGVVLLGVADAKAQEYPQKPISVVVPFAAGGPTDTVARLLGAAMGKSLKTQIIVENVGGAGGTIGAARVAKAPPDGYTLLLHHIGHATAPALYRKLPYDAVGDFEPVGLINEVPMTLVARKDFPPNDLRGLIAFVKANKDKVSYANAGLGAASHLCGMLFMSAIDTDVTTVPYLAANRQVAHSVAEWPVSVAVPSAGWEGALLLPVRYQHDLTDHASASQ